jgi:hypothetical protein
VLSRDSLATYFIWARKASDKQLLIANTHVMIAATFEADNVRTMTAPGDVMIPSTPGATRQHSNSFLRAVQFKRKLDFKTAYVLHGR